MAGVSGVLATAHSSLVAADTTASVLSNPFKQSLKPSSAPCCNVGASKLVVRATDSSSKSDSVANNSNGRRAAMLGLAAVMVSAAGFSGNAKAGLVEDLLAKSAANKELNDKKRLATSEANIARAYTVEFGTCQFPYNFTGCQDLAKTKGVPFLSEDLKLECEGKDKFKCGSNVFWKW
eukprot:Gb_30707 [translate_table: standard]